LRKLIVGAVVASVSLAVAGGAIAQDPESSFSAKVKPADAGTKNKPKNTTVRFNVGLNKPGTTVEFIDLTMPKGLKMSGKGFKRCSAATLAVQGPDGCPAGSKAGPQGTATAMLGTGPEASPLTFEIYPFVQSNDRLLIYVKGLETVVQSPNVLGRITNNGRKLRIQIPPELRQPVPGVDASLTSIDQTFKGKVGKNFLVSSTGCQNKKHKFSGKLTFTTRADGAAVPPPVSLSTTAPCKK
jgi:hypothetical protein